MCAGQNNRSSADESGATDARASENDGARCQMCTVAYNRIMLDHGTSVHDDRAPDFDAGVNDSTR